MINQAYPPDAIITLKCILKGGCALNSSSSKQGPMACLCEHGIEPFGFRKGVEILDTVSDFQFLKNESVLRN
jgi:hypothetical protein